MENQLHIATRHDRLHQEYESLISNQKPTYIKLYIENTKDLIKLEIHFQQCKKVFKTNDNKSIKDLIV